MSNLSSIFDGVIDTEISVKPPLAVLKELGQELQKITKGVLISNIVHGNNQGGFYLEFNITAPALNNYSYHVFKIIHDYNFYPLHIIRETDQKVENQQELEDKLKEIFSSSEVKRVINGLLAQIKSV